MQEILEGELVKDENEEISPDAAYAGLDLREIRYIESYLTHFSQIQAARDAGYKHPQVNGTRVFHREHIQRVIKKAISQYIAEPAEILAQFTAISRGCPEAMQVDDGGYLRINFNALRDAGKLTHIKSVKYVDGLPQVEFYSRLEALTALGKVHALFADRHVIDINMTVSIEHNEKTMKAAMQDPETMAALMAAAEKLRALPEKTG